MNKIRVSTILFLILLILCFVNKKIVKNICFTSIKYVNNIKTSNQENKSIDEFKNYWNKKSQVLNMLIHHDTIDKINEKISELESAIEHNDEENISKNVNTISEMLDSTTKMDNLTLENIL